MLTCELVHVQKCFHLHDAMLITVDDCIQTLESNFEIPFVNNPCEPAQHQLEPWHALGSSSSRNACQASDCHHSSVSVHCKAYGPCAAVIGNHMDDVRTLPVLLLLPQMRSSG